MELRLLEIFAAVAEKKSFSKAAEALFLTQPTVSIHIKALEDSLKLKLFDRRKQTVALTKAGALLYKYAVSILRLKEEAKVSLDAFAGKISGPLSIGASTIPGEYLLPGILKRFISKYRDVRPSVTIADTGRVYEMVRNGDVDLGLVGSRHSIKDIVALPFASDRIVLVAPKNFKKNKIRTSELCSLSFVVREKGPGTLETVEKALLKRKLDCDALKVSAVMGSTQAEISAVKAGLGLAFLSEISVKEHLSTKALKAVRVEGFEIERNFYVVHRRILSNAPIAVKFVEFITRRH